MEKLADVTVDQAITHPNWSMGKKITIDSATLMNKVRRGERVYIRGAAGARAAGLGILQPGRGGGMWKSASGCRARPRDSVPTRTTPAAARHVARCPQGLEVIEAHYLYGVDYDDIEIVIHPQSIIHSMIETADSSVLAQVGAHGRGRMA